MSEQVTLVEAAERLGIPLSTMRSWAVDRPGAKQKIFPAQVIVAEGRGRRRLIHVFDLDEIQAVAARYRPQPSQRGPRLANRTASDVK